MKAFIHIAIILAIVTLGISPACAFVNGSANWIEICAHDGSIKRVQVNDSQTPTPSPDHSKAHKQCDFCFSFAHAKVLGSTATSVPVMQQAQYLHVSSGSWQPLAYQAQSFHARAPPQFS